MEFTKEEGKPIIIREYECGCKITSFKNYFSIDYCPLHKAAPRLYEALEKIRSMTPETIIYNIANVALAEVEGK